jgi:hypothetical protein
MEFKGGTVMKKLGIYMILAFFALETSCIEQSNVSLAKFTERYNEIKNSGFETSTSYTVWANYAGN